MDYKCTQCWNNFFSRYICDPIICDDCMYGKKEQDKEQDNEEQSKRNKIINECIWVLKENRRNPIIDMCIEQLHNLIK